ncbi:MULTISPECIES: (Fe-S)-binding protein [Acidobacteriaceae]|uniref:(Fe-S)-binding protein n=1 Tax=Acidobacteriaceae TaxID=204434 RepID=UPI0020B14CEC|nr:MULTISPECIES: (Fe-S)-binding protein [Acidobacteriaceae]MDW5267324.1 (Fe-S)-binding protein [Edaphobacter sp.]
MVAVARVAMVGARSMDAAFISGIHLSATLAEPAHFSALEVALLLIGIAISLALFFWRFEPILRTIFHSKKDTDFSLYPLGRRVWDFVWEVLCQGKVIRQRPLPGLAHAFVFWGFLAFALVSLNHIANAVGLGFLKPASYIGNFYFLFAAIWAVLVAVSIAALFVRRFFVRPIWLGEKVSYESGVIAFLIFLLMVSYLGAFFVDASGTTVKVLWWTHTLTLLIFLPLIPHTKHLHLVISPFTVFLKRDGFSKIPPLSGDEDFGLAAGKDVTQLISLQVYSCVECGRCTEHCPASNTGKVLNPKEIILGTRSYLNEFGPASETSLLTDMREVPSGDSTAKYMSMEAAFECTTCGSCEYQCPVGIQHLPIIIGLRRGATNTGAWEDTHGTKLFLALEKQGNALGLSAMERDKFIQKQGFPIFDGTQEYCLWLGCMGGYDPKGREIIADFARVMQHLGTTFGVLKKEKCTGDPARRLGNDLVFQTMAEFGLKALDTAKVQKIVAICPHCVRTISNDWREYGIAPEIEHHSEFMARHKDRLPQQNSGESIVYHDPCYLGRYRDVYEEPREIVSMAGKLVEAPRSHERSFCCGAGGGLAFLGEESGERVSHVRAAELAGTGAQIVGTACPFCNTMFRDALSTMGEAPPQLLDIAQLTARALPGITH